MPKILTSLDLGSSQFKGIIAEQKKDGLFSVISVFKKPSAGFRKGVLVDFEEAADSLGELIEDIKKVSKKATENIFINVQSEHVKPRPSRGAVVISNVAREIKGEDIEKVNQLSLAFKASPNSFVLHNITKEYIVDDIGDILDPLGMPGNRLEVETLIIEGVSSQINPLIKLFDSVGASIGGLVFNPLAASEAVLSKKQKNLGVMLIDFGSGTTNIAVFEEGKILHAKTIPIGSSYITNDIAIGLKISVELAEKLKLSYSSAVASGVGRRDVIKLSDIDGKSEGEISRKFLSEIIEVRVAEILDLINNEVKAIGRSVQLPGGVVATGGGVKLYKMDDILREEMKLPAQVGFPNLNRFEILNPAHKEMIDDPEFSVAVGLMQKSGEETGKPAIKIRSIKDFLRNLLP